MVQFAAAVVIIAAQVVIAFLLAPLLTAVALVLIASGAAVGFILLRRAHDLGAETSQFLRGLKLVAGQNRQANFVAEFQDSLATLKHEQLAIFAMKTTTGLPLA
jgi:hypothetical protein